MTFLEYGIDPRRWEPSVDTAGALTSASENMRAQALRVLSRESTTAAGVEA
ncbi:hypothetical protein [Bradyrhizobium sp. USDA 3458]|uniref:hypothetical protein n=1 Tax=Bradyrhizobium sp. USDA 3458 TaxID=2591461 RepID=UPI001FEECF45|nr:hypothetical protein [Bradyrhizobium sp. USDA 3458]